MVRETKKVQWKWMMSITHLEAEDSKTDMGRENHVVCNVM